MLGEQCWGKSKIKRESISCRMELEIEAVNGDSVGGENQVFKASLKREMSSFIREWTTHASRDSLPLRCSPLSFLLLSYFSPSSFFLISSRDDPNARISSLKQHPPKRCFLYKLAVPRFTRSTDRSRKTRERRNERSREFQGKREASRIKDRGTKIAKKKKIGCEAKRGRGKRRRVVAARG